MRSTSTILFLIALGGGFFPTGCDVVVEPFTSACCNPDEEPGVGENPPCVEGAACCADGAWACNEGDERSTCDALCTSETCSAESESCGRNEYCERPTGTCDNANVMGVCQPKRGLKC